MMKAARLFGKNDLRIQDIPVPEPGPGEILLRTAVASICGTDIRMLKHGHPFATPESPLVIGHELSGTIEKTGSGVSGYARGERVCVAPNYNPRRSRLVVAGDGHLDPDYRALGIHEDGAFAEFVRIPADAVAQGNVFPIAEHVSFKEAALIEPMSCVYNAYEKAGTRPGDTVLIIGGGPIGVMHAKISRLAGAAKVILNDFHAERLEIARRLDLVAVRGREPVPKHVRFTTWTLRYADCFWVRLEGLERHWERARVEGNLESDGIRLNTSNATALSLHFDAGLCPFDGFKPVKAVVDGVELELGKPESDRSFHARVERKDGRWRLANGLADVNGLEKRPGLQGPLDDAFLSRFLMVAPTGQPMNAAVGDWVDREFAHAQEHWRLQFRGDAPVKKEVSDEDLAESNLILWGGSPK